MKLRCAALALALGLGACASKADPNAPWLAFAEIAPGATSNRALACDGELCPAASNMRAPIALAASAEAVSAALARIEPDATFHTAPNGDIRARYVAVTRVMRFRDDVDVLIHPLPDGASRVAVYSRSRIGYSDLGANGKRIDTLEAALEAELARSH